MEKRLVKRPCVTIPLKIKGIFLVSVCAVFFGAYAYTVDQSIAVVEEKLITLRDVRLQNLVQYIIREKKVPLDLSSLFTFQTFAQSRDQEIQERLIEVHLKKIQIDFKLAEKDQSNSIQTLTKVFGNKKWAIDFFKRHGFLWNEVKDVLYRKKRRENFIEKQLFFRVNQSESEARTYYDNHKDEYHGKSYEEVKEKVLLQHKFSLLKQEYQKWLEQQKQRVKIVILPVEEESINKSFPLSSGNK